LVVEGEAEHGAIPALLRRAGASPGAPIVFRGQALGCDVSVLVQRKLLSPTRAAVLKNHSKVLVILDRETRENCPGEFACSVLAELVRQLRSNFGYEGQPPVCVICADRSLENWLISDPEGLATHAYIDKDILGRVGANADGRNAVEIIKWAYRANSRYHKRRDAPSLAAKVRVEEQDVRRRSKSLDKLLREAGV
jgi:hypothetical protein